MKSAIVFSAAFAAAQDAHQSWANVVESLHTEDECNSHDSSCSVTLLQMRSNVIKKEVAEDVSHWSYDGPQCTGMSQSPIDLPAAGDVTNSGETLEVSYSPVDASNLKIRNTGHGLKVRAAFGELILPDGVYEAKQLHIRCPSEHTIDGSPKPCEMQIVHQKRGSSGTDDLAVIAIMLQQAKTLGLNADTGRELAFLRRLGLGNRLGLPEAGQEKPIANIPLDLTNAFRRQLQGGYFHYQGSLTTPPCSENVHWYVMKQSAAIAEEMYENFKILFPAPDNSRAVQPLNGRDIVVDTESVADEFAEAKFHWNYAEQDLWSTGHPACSGTSQSPINLEGVPSSHFGAHLNKHVKYHESRGAALTLKNNGHSLQVDSNNDIGYLSLQDGKYYAKQFHFHFPSEHSVNGQLAAGEMHIVHQKKGSTGTNDLAVISILIDDFANVDASPDKGFDEGLDIAFFRDLGFGAKLPRVDTSIPLNVDDIDLSTSFATQLAGPFWHYRGSLTTPPCSETVHWYVVENRATMSHKMITDFKELYPDPANNRNIQDQGFRQVVMEMALPDEFAR